MSPTVVPPRRWTYRYPAVVRGTHWLNAVCLAILVMSGLQIFNAHPALYWGETSRFDRPALWIYTGFTDEGRPVGVTRIFGRTFDTTGVFGRSELNGRPAYRAFPAWLTIPSAQDLAAGRVWHLFFAWVFVLNGVVYLGTSIYGRRLSRDLIPRRDQWRELGATIREHLTFTSRQHASDYNILQKLTYLVVILAVAPLAVLSGLTMSPAITTAAPWLLDLFGGRQSARTIHFLLAGLFVLFALIHVVMVAAFGFLNNMRSMITGWYGTASEGRDR